MAKPGSKAARQIAVMCDLTNPGRIVSAPWPACVPDSSSLAAP
jgi:hypothetical protein